METVPEGNIFGMILKGEIPSVAVYGNNDVYCFLDLYPQNPGHTLVVPYNYSANLLEAAEEDIAACQRAIRKLTPALLEATGAKGVTVTTNLGREAGQMIEYLHFHLIPRHPGDNISHYILGKEQTPEEMEEMAAKIKSLL